MESFRLAGFREGSELIESMSQGDPVQDEQNVWDQRSRFKSNPITTT